MALGRQILKPVKMVLPHDSALVEDEAEFDYTDYAKAHYDPAMLRFKPGEKPTWFTVQQLTPRQRQACANEDAGYDRHMLTVRCGLVAVSGWEMYDSNGGPLTMDAIERKAVGKLGELVTERWLDHVDFGELTIALLATAVERMSLPEIPLSKRSVTPAGVTESAPAAAETSEK